MTIWRIIVANLKYSWRQHFGTCLGVALASMILVGALTIGDSVKASLQFQATKRIGKITPPFFSEDSFFHANLSDRMQEEMPEGTDAYFALLIMTQGILSSVDGKMRASGVQVIGLDDQFFNSHLDTRFHPAFPRWVFGQVQI